MAVYIESRYNSGYIAHHARDEIMVKIIHNPEDGYLLSYDKEVIKESLTLKLFVQRLRSAEGAQKNSLESEIHDIDRALRQRKEKEVAEWLDHRHMKLIRDQKIVLMQHRHSVNIRHIELPRNYTQPMTPDEAWNPDQVKKKQEEMGIVFKGVKDEEVYYTMIK